MEAAGGGAAAGLTPPAGSPLARLLADPYRFDFFQAVRVLARAADGADDAIRFRAAVGLGFPASPIAAVAGGPAAGTPFEVAVTFLGLTGPSGVLPRHYSEALIRLRPDPGHEALPALRDWLDLFNHRLTALFYEAWAKYRPDVAEERAGAATPPKESEYAAAYLSLIGLGAPALRDRVRAPAGVSSGPPAADAPLILHGGVFARHPRTAAGLEAVLTAHLGVGVRVVQFVGRWLPLAAPAQTRLGCPDGSTTLGRTAVAGRRVWDAGAVRVRVGPLTGAQFAALLPGDGVTDGPFARLVRLTRFYLGPEFDFDVQLVPLAAEAPPARVGLAGGSQLGRNSWLRSVPATSDPEDVVLRTD